MKKHLIYFVLFVIFLVSSWSLFRPEFFFTHDFTHGARIVEMHKALVDGHFPVRWSSDFGFGYGMPLFEFYAPLPYYVGAVFYWLGFSLVNSVKLLFLISTLVVLVGGYKLGKALFGTSGGLVVAALVTLSSYRAVNLFVRGAISEAWGIMVLPFILLGIIKVIRRETFAWVTLTISLVVLFLSHNLTSLIFLPLSVVFGAGYLVLYQRDKKKKISYFYNRTLALAGIYSLSVLISSFYLIPAFFEKNFTRVESAILGGYFDYKLHFLYIRQFLSNNWQYGGSQWGPDDGISFYLGTAQILSILFLFVLILISLWKVFRRKGKLNFKNWKVILETKYMLLVLTFVLFLTSLFMTLGHSSFIWSSVSVLEFIQFPWRWLSASIVFLAVIAGFITWFIETKSIRYIVSSIIIVVAISSSWNYFQPESYLLNAEDFYYSDQTTIRTQMSSILPDYIPVQMVGINLDPVAAINTSLSCQIDDSCGFEVTSLVDKTHQKLIEVDLTSEALLDFNVADYPGWTVEVDGVNAKHEVSSFGTIVVPVKEGVHKVGLELKSTKIRYTSDILTVLGLVVFLSVFFWYHGGLEDKMKSKKND